VRQRSHAGHPKERDDTLLLLLARWQRDSLPADAQFDNDNVFQGAHQYAHTAGRVRRICLQLGMTPVFVPPLEHGMQNTFESFSAVVDQGLAAAPYG